MQIGFRKMDTTTTALVDISDNIIKTLVKNLAVALLSIDCNNDFDKINHTLLLANLKYYGFKYWTLSIIKNYLTNRSEFIQLFDTNQFLRCTSRRSFMGIYYF